MKKHSRTATQRHRRSNSITRIGMLSFLTISLLASCKKDVAKSNSLVGNSKSTARMIPDGEAAILATQVNDFAYYADAYLLNTSATIPQGLSATLSSEEANDLLENTYNFIYSERDDELLCDSPVEVSIVLNKNNSGLLAMGDVAAAYNSSFSTLKSAFLSFAGTDKVLSYVDVEITNEASTTSTMSFTAHFGWNKVPTPTELTTLDGTYFPTVPNGDYWHWFHLKGKFGTPAYDGIKGSPELIAQYVRAYKGYYSPTAAVRFKTGINLKVASTDPSVYPKIPIDGFLPTAAPNTPDYPGRTGVWYGSCLLHTNLYYTPIDSKQDFLTGYAVNYHITQCPTLLTRAETATGKAVWTFNLHALLSLGTSDPLWAKHFITVTCADQVNTPIIISNLPYRATAPSSKPFKL